MSVLGETKSLAESVATALCGDRVPLTVVRPQDVIGPGQSLHDPHTGVLAAFLAMLREQRPLALYGDGHQTRDFVHVDDVAALLGHLVAAPPEPGHPLVLNAGTGVRTSLVELARLAADAAPVPNAGTVQRGVRRAGDVEHACADLRRLSETGAPLPVHSTAQAVDDFVRASWDLPGLPASAWDDALVELERHGLTR